MLQRSSRQNHERIQECRTPADRRCSLFVFFAVAVAAGLFGSGVIRAEEDLGVKVPEGFGVSLFADDELAHDIFAMTIDSHGRVVVSGPGYVRILIDADGDGKAESFQQFSDGPANGAQGLFFHGNDLLCTGDAGLLRYQDKDGDDRADGPPDLFLKIRTGDEHTAHAIRRGPDGWWYIIAGNQSEIGKAYANLPTSPIRDPRDGALLRLSPDLSSGEVIADGYRNAYDFDFHSVGDLFVFDSDDERDVSLPWYRPTRVFQALPGSNAGWVSKSWKHPDYFHDMPPVVAACGRGSPTGVECYRHRQFPPPYRGALFVLDWTFGRVIALPLKPDGSAWSTKQIDFVTSIGRFGFAPTDAAVGPDGSLYISVGGRGTRGGVYRIVYNENTNDSATVSEGEPRTNDEKLAACLNAPQPLSSWSRARWLPLARELGRDPFVKAARNESLPSGARIRAIEILTEVYGGLDAEVLAALSKSKPVGVRARAIWSHGRNHTQQPDPMSVSRYLDDPSPLVQRAALEVLLGAGSDVDLRSLIPELTNLLRSRDRFVRQSAGRVIARRPEEIAQRIDDRLHDTDLQALLALAFGRVDRPEKLDKDAIDLGVSIVEGNYPAALKLEALRLVQLALGDVGPRPPIAAAFDGYHSRIDLSSEERQLDPVRIRLAKLFPMGDRDLDHELLRLLAVVAPYNAELFDKILGTITESSDPVDDIHRLIVCARIPIERTNQQQAKIAAALVALEPKIKSRGLRQDQHWDERVGELYKRLVEIDPYLPAAIVANKEFGRPGHVLFMSELGGESLKPAIEGFVRQIQVDPDYAWTTNVIFAIAGSDDPRHYELIRKQYDRFAVRSAVLMSLAEKPSEVDRPRFVEGLESSQLEVLSACLDALEKLPLRKDAKEQGALVATLRRLGANSAEFRLRERVAKVLERSTGQTHGFEFGEVGFHPQPTVVEKWSDWLKRNFPEELARQEAAARAESDQLKTLLSGVTWEQGDAGRGQKLFEARSCAQCHGERQALGPDLSGVASRFSREDLFTAIVFPDRDVSPRYQTTMFQTHDGKAYTGRVIYEAVDGIILRNATNQTFRIEPAQIEERRALPTSLMPLGLLKDLKPADVADLYAYLKSLGAAQTARAQTTGAD